MGKWRQWLLVMFKEVFMSLSIPIGHFRDEELISEKRGQFEHAFPCMDPDHPNLVMTQR